MPRKTVLKLSPEDEFRQKAVLEEIARRRHEGRAEVYAPKFYQEPFHKSEAKRIIVHGGWRSGKTYSACMEVLWNCLGKHPLKDVPPPPVHWRVCGSGMEEQVEKVLAEIFRTITPRNVLEGDTFNYSAKSHMLRFKNGSWIEFMSFDQDPEKGAGRALHGVLLDDVGCPKRFADQCLRRLTDYHGVAIRTLCPEENGAEGWEMDWYERAANGDSDYARFRMRTMDNDSLSDAGLKQLLADIGDDEDTLKFGLEGDFISLGGLIYKNLRKSVHMIEGGLIGFDRSWPRFLCIDPGIQKEHAVMWGAVGPGNHIHFYREYAEAGTIPDLCKSIRLLSGLDPHITEFFIDGHWDWDNRTASSAYGPDPLNIEKEFIKSGIPVRKAPLDIRMWQGIDQVRERLKVDPISQRPLITFEPELDRAWYEMTHYAQVNPKKVSPNRHNPRIRKVDDDFCDCVRIAITSNPQFSNFLVGKMYQPQVYVDEYGMGF